MSLSRFLVDFSIFDHFDLLIDISLIYIELHIRCGGRVFCARYKFSRFAILIVTYICSSHIHCTVNSKFREHFSNEFLIGKNLF